MNILEPTDKSNIRVAYEYEFCRGTNASQTARNINEMFGDNVANEQTVVDVLRGFALVISGLKINPMLSLFLRKSSTRFCKLSQKMRALAKRFNVSISTVLDHLKQTVNLLLFVYNIVK